MKKFLYGAIAGATMLLLVTPALADTITVDFESPTYTVGNINGQDGWMKTGAFDSVVALNTYGFASFGSQSLRISDAVTSGSFGDQTFAKPLTDSVGETGATAGSYSVGTKQTHFEMQFDIASTVLTEQPGLHMSVSPDRGDGSRMSYLRFQDQSDGIHVFFDDVTDAGPLPTTATFNEFDIATIDRTPHTVKLTFDAVDGPANDVVKVWIDGVLKHTGTSWEDYYRYDSEASAEQSPRIVKTVLFRESGDPSALNVGNGFLIDNFSQKAIAPVLPSVPTITTPANDSYVTSAALVKVDWTDSTGTFSPFEYQYEAFSDAGYTSSIYASGWLTASEIPTPGTPEGVYYVRVRAKDTNGTMSDWSNDALLPYKITVDNTAPNLTFSGFRDQDNATYDNTKAIKVCGATNTTGYIAWEWLLNNVEPTPVTYTYLITSGPTAVGFTTTTPNTYFNGGIPMLGTYGVQVTAADGAGNISAPVACGVVFATPTPTPTPIVGPPSTMDQCKNNGWRTFNAPIFKNQGDCVSWLMSSANAVGNKKNN